jgi:hypothetical protein
VGGTAQLTATTRSASGGTLTGRQVSWSSNDQTIAGVSTSGLVSGVKAGSTTITATSEGVHRDVSVTVTPNAVASLSFVTQPTTAAAGASIGSVQVRMLDALGNVVASTAAVTVTLTGGDAGATLAGTATVNAVAGAATFSDLSIARRGTGYKLVATSGALQATSNAFDINAAAPSAIAKVAGDAQSAVAGTAVSVAPSVKVTDAFGNAVNGTTVVFAPASGSGSVVGGSAQTDANGIATVGSWTVGTAMGPNALTATATTVSTTFNATVTGAVAPGVQLVVGALGSASTTSVATGHDITIPITLDLTNRGADNLASIQLTITWDPAKLTFKSDAAGNWVDSQQQPGQVTPNTTGAASGILRYAGFTTSETLTSFVLRNLTFTATGSATSVDVTATVTAAGNASGTAITVGARPLSVTVTP